MTDKQQPDALRIAESLDAVPETGADPQTIQDAAAELRRLHTELETLRASHGQASAQDANEHLDLLAQCRSAFPIPERGDPLEVHWAAAMADPGEVPGYLQEIAARHAAQAAPAAVVGCTRSHPHENMDNACRAKSAIAEMQNMAARGAPATAHDLERFVAMLAAAPTTQPAPQQEAQHLAQALTDPENQPNQYGVEFGMSGTHMHFKIGNQLFKLAYEPDEQEEFDFMKRMLVNAFTTFTHDVKTAPPPSPAAQGDALPREDFAWLVVQEACETEPADEDDPECVRILRRDLKSSVLAAFLRLDAARAAQEGKSCPKE